MNSLLLLLYNIYKCMYISYSFIKKWRIVVNIFYGDLDQANIIQLRMSIVSSSNV